MQPDRGLAAAGAALNHDQARVRPGDELELARIDERGDLAQVLVLGRFVAEAEPAGAMVLLGAQRRARAAGEAVAAHVGAPKAARSRAHEGALRRADAAQHAVGDGDAAAREDHARDLAIAEDLVVVVALFVAVVEPAHRRVAPVDDAHAALGVEVGAASDEHLAPAASLPRAPGARSRASAGQPGFPRPCGAGRRAPAGAPSAGRAAARPRGEPRRSGRGGRAGARRRSRRRVAASGPGLGEVLEHPREAGLLLADDAVELLVRGGGFRVWSSARAPFRGGRIA